MGALLNTRRRRNNNYSFFILHSSLFILIRW
nr:MAG TPA: hypothetical protein [Caudoviricetes sp.]